MIGVIDYGAGNLLSVTNALDRLELAWRHVRAAGDLTGCSRIILPGVGHFGFAMNELAARKLVEPLRDAAGGGMPLLGLCLGAQLLLDASDEAAGGAGLGLISGQVVRLATKTIPHMGWNRVRPRPGARLFEPVGEARHFYFAHSYVCRPRCGEDIAAESICDGQGLCVAVERGNIFGVQFHPEKSASAGLDLLRRFATC